MNQQRQASALQIRKSKKEELFRRKRQMLSPNTQTTATQQSNAGDATSLPAAIDHYIKLANSENLVRLERKLASGSSSSNGETAAVLQGFIHDDLWKAKDVVSHATRHAQDQDETIRLAALAVLLELSSVPSQLLGPQDYYGLTPAKWSDLLIDEPSLMTTLSACLSSADCIESATYIIGNLVQESPQAVAAVRSFWPVLVANLPNTVYACAAVVRQDATSFGMDFLQSLTTHHIAQLLQHDRTCVEAAWILESLTRREDAAVDCILSDGNLFGALVHQLHEATVQAKTNLLTPALQAIGNIATSCEGRHVHLLLSDTVFVQTLVHLLEQGTQLDAVWVAGCFLCDAGIPLHSSTQIAVPAFLPPLVAIVSSESASLNWKRDAVCALWNAISEPPGGISSSDHDNEMLLRQILQDHVWTTATTVDEFMQACIDLLGRSDMDAVLASLQVCDRILRSFVDSRVTFESLAGVDRLEGVCDKAVGQNSAALESASVLAAALLDDFFDVDNRENEQEEAPETAPGIDGNQFVFGAPAAAAVDRGATEFSFSSVESAAGRGRGRGRTLPAWMSK